MTETVFTSAALNAASLPAPLLRALADLADVLAGGDVDALALALETLPIATAPADQVLAMAMALGVMAQRSSDAAQQAHLLARQGQLLTDSGPFELTKPTLTRACVLAQQRGLPDLLWATRSTLARALARQGDLAGCVENLQFAVEAATTAGNTRAVGRTMVNIGNALCEMGRFAEAGEYASRALQIALDNSDDAEQVNARLLLGTTQLQTGAFAKAARTWQQAIVLARKTNRRHTAGVLYANMAAAHFRRGLTQSAMRDYEQAARCFEDAGATRDFARLMVSIGVLQADEGRMDAALKNLNAGVQAHLDALDYADAATGLCALAEAQLDSGDAAGAADALARARALDGPALSTPARLAISRAAAALAHKTRPPEAAIEAAEEFQRQARAMGRKDEEAAALALLAKTHLAAGQAERADDAAQQALQMLQRAKLVPGVLQLEMLVLCVRAAMAGGDTTQARWLLDQAQEVAARLPQVQQQRGARASALARQLQQLAG